MRPVPWREAMARALYGPDGFYRHDAGPGAHFRTSAHTGAVFTGAILRVLDAVDAALGHPARLDVVDIGAGHGELLTGLLARTSPAMAARIRPVAVEVGTRPDGVPAAIGWRQDPPDRIDGLLIATEWLDNVPVDVAVRRDGSWRYARVDGDGVESPGDPVTAEDAAWLDRWWPRTGPAGRPGGERAEIGRDRDLAWVDALATVRHGLALAVDYGHLADARPALGTLTGFRHGREVHPVPDGSCDLTAHVAMDAVATAGSAAVGLDFSLVRQADALRALGVTGRRPPLELARRDPGRYVRALAAASTAAELTDPAGLGGHLWLRQPVGLDPATLGAVGSGPPAPGTDGDPAPRMAGWASSITRDASDER